MESPPSTSTLSETFMLSDDSGLLLTSGSISSGSMSGESRSFCAHLPEFHDSDCEDKSLSQADSLDGMSDIICGENFNTLKKGPHYTDQIIFKTTSPIEPPPEFQDKPSTETYEKFADYYTDYLLDMAFHEFEKYLQEFHATRNAKMQICQTTLSRPFWSPLTFSPCHGARPSSRSSLGSSRLSSSHNSLSVPTAHRADDSSFIMQAVSHDTLTSNQISDLYNVPFDSDVYAIPVDTICPPIKPKRTQLHAAKKRRRHTSSGFREYDSHSGRQVAAVSMTTKKTIKSEHRCVSVDASCPTGKRHSVAGTSQNNHESEPIRMTLQEVRQYLQTLYSSSSDSSEQKEYILKPNAIRNNNINLDTHNVMMMKENLLHNTRVTNNSNNINNNNNKKNVVKGVKKVKEETTKPVTNRQVSPNKQNKWKKTQSRISSFKQSLCSIFKPKKTLLEEKSGCNFKGSCNFNGSCDNLDPDINKNITNRALPPLPPEEEHAMDFATSIRKVKDYGWYWGPLSGEAAEKILSNEPDGSFIVRDSSDDHYIFSLTLKLNNSVRHVRIEHDQGNFSFGNYTKFKSQTIVEFIENAVEHSRSGRYLFFLNRRPTIGPARVQLLHPVSRFKQIQSLQHMCRFVINKHVRKDLIQQLPLPRRMIDYLSTPHYYSELIDDEQMEQEVHRETSTPIVEEEGTVSRIGNYIYVRTNNSVGTQHS
nr:metabotropic glutamate receptor-like protein P isoform X1 [Onthophagus taurus]